MTLRSAMVLATVWALTVVAVAVVTWQVIHTAGQGVLDESSLPELTQTVGSTPSPSPSPDSVWRPAHPQTAGADATTSPTSAPTGAGSPAATSSQPTTKPSHPVPAHSPSSSSAPNPGGHHGTPTSTPSPTTASPGPSVASWRGDAGVVTVSCELGRIRLLGATPADGYRLEVEQETDHVQVHFEREDPAHEVQVEARCTNGVPRFDVEQDDRTQEDRPSARLTS